MIPAVTLSPAPHMAPGCIPAVSVSIWSGLMSEASGWAPVPSMLSKAAAVLGPGLVLLTVLVPAMLSRPDSAFIPSLTQSCVPSFARWWALPSVHSFLCTIFHSLIHQFPHSFIRSCVHSFILPLIHLSLTRSLPCATDVSPWSQVCTVLEWLFV